MPVNTKETVLHPFPRNLVTGREPGVYFYGKPGKKDWGMDFDYGGGFNTLNLLNLFPKVEADKRLTIHRIAPDTRLIISQNHLSYALI